MVLSFILRSASSYPLMEQVNGDLHISEGKVSARSCAWLQEEFIGGGGGTEHYSNIFPGDLCDTMATEILMPKLEVLILLGRNVSLETTARHSAVSMTGRLRWSSLASLRDCAEPALPSWLSKVSPRCRSSSRSPRTAGPTYAWPGVSRCRTCRRRSCRPSLRRGWMQP